MTNNKDQLVYCHACKTMQPFLDDRGICMECGNAQVAYEIPLNNIGSKLSEWISKHTIDPKEQ